MGFGGISIWQLLIILAIVVLLFGTKRLKGIGGDLGSAIKGFKKAMDSDEAPKEEDKPQQKIVDDSTQAGSTMNNKANETTSEQKDKQD